VLRLHISWVRFQNAAAEKNGDLHWTTEDLATRLHDNRQAWSKTTRIRDAANLKSDRYTQQKTAARGATVAAAPKFAMSELPLVGSIEAIAGRFLINLPSCIEAASR
jgi:hypothetical protein